MAWKKVSENFVGKLGISAFRFFLVEIRTSIKNRFSGANKMKSLGILKSIENGLFSVFLVFSTDKMLCRGEIFELGAFLAPPTTQGLVVFY